MDSLQAQIIKAKLSFKKISHIFITHLHGDHCYGTPGLLAMLSMIGVEHNVFLAGPKGIKKYLQTVFEVTQLFLKYTLEIFEMEEDKPFELAQVEGLKVEAYPLKHRVQCFGYVIKEKERPGKFESKIALVKGVEKASIPKLLKGESVQTCGGKILKKEDCLGPNIKGRKIVILGDTSDSKSIEQAAFGCDVILHECTFDKSMKERAEKTGHSTSEMAARFADKIQAKNLILTHFSARYLQFATEHNPIPLSKLLEEATEFSGQTKIHLAHDLFTFQVHPYQYAPI